MTGSGNSSTAEAAMAEREAWCKAPTQDPKTKKHTGPLCTRKKVFDDRKLQESKTVEDLVADELCSQHKKTQERFVHIIIPQLNLDDFVPCTSASVASVVAATTSHKSSGVDCKRESNSSGPDARTIFIPETELNPISTGSKSNASGRTKRVMPMPANCSNLESDDSSPQSTPTNTDYRADQESRILHSPWNNQNDTAAAGPKGLLFQASNHQSKLRAPDPQAHKTGGSSTGNTSTSAFAKAKTFVKRWGALIASRSSSTANDDTAEDIVDTAAQDSVIGPGNPGHPKAHARYFWKGTGNGQRQYSSYRTRRQWFSSILYGRYQQ